MEVSFSLTRRQFLAYQWFVRFQVFRTRTTLTGLLALGFAVWMGWIWLHEVSLRGNLANWWSRARWTSRLLPFEVVALPAFWMALPWIWARRWSSLPGTLGQRTVVIDERGLEMRRPDGTVQHDWTFLAQPRVHRGALYLFRLGRGVVTTVIVPADAFPSDADFHAFAAKATELWNAAKTKPT